MFGLTALNERPGQDKTIGKIGDSAKGMMQKANEKFREREDYVMVQEYIVKSGLNLNFYKSENGKLESVMDGKYQCRGEHVLRVEKPVFESEFFFVINNFLGDNDENVVNKIVYLCDFDCYMRGNPHAYVKNYM